MRSFIKGEIYLFECDMRGRNVNYDGYKNSQGGKERPFLILTQEKWNNDNKNEGMYALPLTGGGEGNVFSIPVKEEFFENPVDFGKLNRSIILCDKICRINEKDIFKKNCKKQSRIQINFCNQAKNKIKDFINMNI